MAKGKSSKRWLKEHFDDAYVKQAQVAGYRSRAVFKLKEIDNKDHLLKPGMLVVDLGAAPGGWAQYASERLAGRGEILALDILPMDALPGVDFIQGDFTEQAVYDQLLLRLEGRQADLVISDMAPNLSGTKAIDQPKAIYLAELALEMAQKVLKPGGDFLVKIFQGEGSDVFRAECKKRFQKVITRQTGLWRHRVSE